MNKKQFDESSASSIIAFAKNLKDSTLRKSCDDQIQEHNYRGKGNYGQLLEKYYFGYEPNSDANPDFKEAGLELKSSPLKYLKNGSIRSKERLVLNIIDYMNVHNESFFGSTFYKKNAHLLLVFYLHNKDADLLDYLIKLVDDWKFPEQDMKIIKQDWNVIIEKIKNGKAHELSEGDTFYLGACTKGASAKSSFRQQPFSDKMAKQRAFSFKQGYVNHIIANLSGTLDDSYGKILDSSAKIESDIENNLAADLVADYNVESLKEVQYESLEDSIIERFKNFYGKTTSEIEGLLQSNLNTRAKSYYANLTKAILGIDEGKKIEEFEKADLEIKTIRIERDGKIKESISFPAFKFLNIYQESWIFSDLKATVEKKFFFVFFRNNGVEYVLDKVKFWNMGFQDRQEVRKVWLATKKIVQSGNIISGYRIQKDGKRIRLNNFPKKTESIVCHVRPHGRNAMDTYPLPKKDKISGTDSFTKQCFWLNRDYIKQDIYLK